MASGLVLMDDILVRDAINHAYVFDVSSLCGSFVTCFNRFDDLFDRGAQSGT
jgi:hypothetical protein